MRKIILITSLLALIAGYAYISNGSSEDINNNSGNPQKSETNDETIKDTTSDFLNNLIPSKDYSSKQISSKKINSGLINLNDEAQDDCVAITNGETGGGDLISTLITNQVAREKATLKNYTPDYLKELEHMITQDTGSKYDSDFYAFKTCNIAPKLDVVAGYLWPKGQATSQDNGFGTQKALIIVDNNKVIIYDNVTLLNASATGDEVLPCKTKIEGNNTIRWSCFKGFKVENGNIVGDNVKEYLFSLSGEAPKVWEGIKNITTIPAPEGFKDSTENTDQENTEDPKTEETKEIPEEENETTTPTKTTAVPPITAPNSIAARSQKEQIKFNSCGGLALYFNEPWYKELESAATRTRVDLKKVNQGCFSTNGQILTMVKPAQNFAFGEIYRYDTLTQNLERAHIDGKTQGNALASPEKFGKRVDNTILLEGNGGDLDCNGTYSYEYDFVNNVVELKKTEIKCEGKELKVETY